MAKDFFGINSKLAFENFFDHSKVIKAVDRKTAAAMKHVGGTTRTIANRSVKKSTGRTLHSPPGKPVRTQTGIYKKTIFFEYEFRKREMICGPKKLPKKSNIKSNKTTPQLLEEGGTGRPIKRQFIRVKNKGRGKKRRFKGKGKDKKFVFVPLPDKPFKYKARPTMKLAAAKSFAQPKLKQAFETIGFRTR